jgi:putative Holliday junction resolvase
VTAALGLDAGSVRVGLAAADPTGTLATPIAVLRRTRPAELWERVRREAAERGADTVVVGLPRELDLWDERFTSAEAVRALVAGGMRRARRRETVDGVAAALMLQGWLDARRIRTGPRAR